MWGSFSDNTELRWRPRLKKYQNNTKLLLFNHGDHTAYSQGSQFLGYIGNKLVLNTSAYYFHVREIERVCKALKIRIHVKAAFPCRMSEFKTDALPILYKKVAELEAEIAYRPLQTKCEGRREWWNDKIRELKSQIQAMRSLGAKYAIEQIRLDKKVAIQAIQNELAQQKQNRREGALRAAAGRKALNESWKNQNAKNGVNNEQFNDQNQSDQSSTGLALSEAKSQND